MCVSTSSKCTTISCSLRCFLIASLTGATCFGYRLPGLNDGAIHWWMLTDTSVGFTDPLSQEQLVQVDRQCSDLRSVLHWLGHLFWKTRPVLCSAVWTALDLRLMFDDFHKWRRQIKHMPLFNATARHRWKRCLAVMTILHRIHLDVIRMNNCFQGIAGVVWGCPPVFFS